MAKAKTKRQPTTLDAMLKEAFVIQDHIRKACDSLTKSAWSMDREDAEYHAGKDHLERVRERFDGFVDRLRRVERDDKE